MTGERNTLQAELKQISRELEKMRAIHEAAAQRTTELERERDTLRAEARQMVRDLEQARAAVAAQGAPKGKRQTRPKYE